MRQLDGSCHCGAVNFTLKSSGPVPYMRCYCSICRKTAGGGGYAINLSGDAATLKIDGEEHLSMYRVRLAARHPDALSPAQRYFCKHCGSALYVFDPRWPELVHPFASAIDSDLPPAPNNVHIMLQSKANWVEVSAKRGETGADEYPELSIEDWHRRHGLWEGDRGGEGPE